MAFNITPASIISDIELGFDLLTGANNADVVGVFDQISMQQVFANTRPVRATVKETSKVMDYPVETGATLSDHHIINPTEIEIAFILTAQNYSDYQQMRTAWTNATTLSIQTRTGVYSNMIIWNMPHVEEPEMFDAITLSVMFREVIFVVPSSSSQPMNYAPLNPVNSDTISRGFQLSKAIVNQVSAGGSFIRAANVFGIGIGGHI